LLINFKMRTSTKSNCIARTRLAAQPRRDVLARGALALVERIERLFGHQRAALRSKLAEARAVAFCRCSRAALVGRLLRQQPPHRRVRARGVLLERLDQLGASQHELAVRARL